MLDTVKKFSNVLLSFIFWGQNAIILHPGTHNQNFRNNSLVSSSPSPIFKIYIPFDSDDSSSITIIS